MLPVLPKYTIRLQDEESLWLAVFALMKKCEHGHWFFVQRDENAISINPSGLECLKVQGFRWSEYPQ